MGIFEDAEVERHELIDLRGRRLFEARGDADRVAGELADVLDRSPAGHYFYIGRAHGGEPNTKAKIVVCK